MEIIVGKYAGFCYGVNRAVDGLNKIIEENSKEETNIKCYGEIVHNNNVVKDFQEKKVEFIEDLNKVNREDKVVIRAHGIRKEDYELLKEKGIDYKDFTCHNVLRVHKIVENNRDSLIILTGDRNHPENIGTISFAKDIIVINNPEELADENIIKRIKEQSKKNKRIVLISQTTYSMEKFNIIVGLLKKILKGTDINLDIEKTICSSTRFRQLETEEIAKKVELMIIIGSKTSSNTKKLKEVAEKYTKTIMIDTENDLDETIFAHNKIGIMAGASVPSYIIDNVVEFLKSQKSKMNK